MNKCFEQVRINRNLAIIFGLVDNVAFVECEYYNTNIGMISLTILSEIPCRMTFL